jgi:diguanylate cyclase (GGDEF)-like protein
VLRVLRGERAGLRRVRSWNTVAWLLLVAGVGMSLLGASLWQTEARSQAEQSFRSEAATVGSTVTTGLLRMDDLTVAARTLIQANPELTNADLAGWYQSIGAQHRYPGALGFGYVERVPQAALAAFADVLRADPVPGFTAPGQSLKIIPSGTRKTYCLIRLAVAGAMAQLIPGAGYDLCAIAGASSFLASPKTGAITVVSATMPSLGQILIVSAPVYSGGGLPSTVSGSRVRMIGWMIGAFDVGRVLGGAVLGDAALSVSVSRQAVTGSVPAAAGSAAAGPGRLTSVAKVGRASAGASLRRTFTLDADGHWVVTVAKAPGWGWFSPTLQGLAVLVAGIMVSLLVFFLVQVLARGRARALQMVDEKTDELRYQALHDTLTGLPNRALIIDRVEQLLARARRERTEAAAMFLDLDDFKSVNDTFGHGVGDELLKAVAERISGSLRDADTVGRLGGDEFIVLLESNPRLSQPKLVAERLLDVLREPFRLDALGDGTLSLGASIGIARGDRRSGMDLLRDADIALYQAKTAGKHRYAIFRKEMHETVHDRLELELDLNGAVERGELFLDYQPTFDLARETLTGVEALLRWRHPSRGIVVPDEFVPIAESTGLIVPIGRWVLETACAQARAWHDQGDAIDLSVNISAVQLDDPALHETVAHALAATGLDPTFLTLEITETALMRNPERVVGRLAKLKALGLRIAIDDFGTGYSSLAYLQQFPVDALKIDKSFISHIATSAESKALIRTLVHLGQSLNLRTVAEGIETEAQLAELRRGDCTLGQGFLLARPLDPAGMQALLEQTRPARLTDDSRPGAAARPTRSRRHVDAVTNGD